MHKEHVLETDSLWTVTGTQGSQVSLVALKLERVWQIALTWGCSGVAKYKKNGYCGMWLAKTSSWSADFGEADEENEEKSFSLLRLGRCLCLCNTSGTAENCLSSDVRARLRITKHTNVVCLVFPSVCACRELSSYLFTSNWFKLELLRKEPWKRNSFVFWRMSSDNEVYLR